MSQPTVVFVDGYNWEGVYVNGELKDEGHNLSVRMVLDAVGVAYGNITLEGQEEENFFEEISGILPSELGEVAAILQQLREVTSDNSIIDTEWSI